VGVTVLQLTNLLLSVVQDALGDPLMPASPLLF
jgi:hypothetical protein